MSVLRMLESVIMISGTVQMRYDSIDYRKGSGDSFPHLPAGLIQHVSVKCIVVILLHKISGTQDSLDVELIHIVGNPSGHQIENRLIKIILDITLRVTKKDECLR